MQGRRSRALAERTGSALFGKKHGEVEGFVCVPVRFRALTACN